MTTLAPEPDNRVIADETADREPSRLQSGPPGARLTPALDPIARRTKGAFQYLNSSSAGLEMGVSVIIGLLFGRWLDGRIGTTPWMMILFLCFGFAAGIRSVVRAMKRSTREAEENSAAKAQS